MHVLQRTVLGGHRSHRVEIRPEAEAPRVDVEGRRLSRLLARVQN